MRQELAVVVNHLVYKMKYLLLLITSICFGQVTDGCLNTSGNIFNLNNNEKAFYIVEIFSYKNKNIYDLLKREEEELKKNFPEIPIKKISTFGRYKSNNQTFYFDETCKNYGDILFSTGNQKDSIFENRKIILTSEFISQKLKTKEKKSSYILDFEKEKGVFLNKLNFITDDNSKTLSNLFLDLMINQKMLRNFLLPPFKFTKKRKLKKIEVKLTNYLPKGNVFISPFSFFQPQIGNFTFDENGNVNKIVIKDDNFKDIAFYYISYKNGLVTENSEKVFSTNISGETAKSEWKTQNQYVYYNGDNLIVDMGKNENEGGKSAYNIFKINENWKDKIINETYLFDNKNYNITLNKNLDRNCFFDEKLFFFKICYEDIAMKNFPSSIKLSDYDFIINKDIKDSAFEIEYISPNKSKAIQKYTYDDNGNLINISLYLDEKIIKKWNLNYSFYK